MKIILNFWSLASTLSANITSVNYCVQFTFFKDFTQTSRWKTLYQLSYILKPSHQFIIKNNKRRLTCTSLFGCLLCVPIFYSIVSRISRIMIHIRIFTSLTIIKEKVKRIMWLSSKNSLKFLLRLTSCITIIFMFLENINPDFNAFQESSH